MAILFPFSKRKQYLKVHTFSPLGLEPTLPQLSSHYTLLTLQASLKHHLLQEAFYGCLD